ncbi:MAG: type II toxin-antitoxin system YafQ family toxin [Defluviitaleaceae bacterium]|nr:type II toxin-antitoxin system YafQ family toxin [Defluviitaleaceae bacterium]
MKYKIRRTPKFKREFRKVLKRGYDEALFEEVVAKLASGKQLEPKYRDHALVGNYTGFRECHITPDWLLIYKIEADVLILVLQRTGTHSDLF